MAASGQDLMNKLLQRQKYCEEQTKSLQAQVAAFQRYFKVPQSEIESAVNNQAPVAAVSSEVSNVIPDGKYAVFISSKAQPFPMDVIAAFKMAEHAIKSSGRSKAVKLILVDKANMVVPKMNITTASKKAELLGNTNVARFLFRMAGQEPSDAITTTQIDSWIYKSIALQSMTKDTFGEFISTLNDYLRLRSVLVGYTPTSCDIAVWSALRGNALWTKASATVSPPSKGPVHVLRWFTMMEECPMVQDAKLHAAALEEGAKKKLAAQQKAAQKKAKKQQKGKKGKSQEKAKPVASASWDIGIGKEYQGRIVTRFPPEPSGYLHIGHAKAVFLNAKQAERFGGKLIVRMDDTNPSKEKAEFEENIKRDLVTLGVKMDHFSHTSDHFDYYLKCCTRVIKAGNAYCDQTPALEMKEERGNCIESKYRTQPVEENLRLWKEMIEGTEEGQKTCVRIKLDMKSNNGTLRDPTIYRCNVKDAHHQTGKKYKVYPTYDFACPIVDSIEGVTHAFRSKEYNERDEQYRLIWDIVCKDQKNPNEDTVCIKKGTPLVLPNIFQFSRLDFVRTVLSKRKLAKLIERGVVDGWDDPRLPTVQGIFRRGLQLEALEQFVADQAMSDKNTEQEWDKIWSFNDKVLDPKVGRYFCVSEEEKVTITLTNVPEPKGITVPLAHSKYERLKGKTKVMEFASTVYVERLSVEMALEKIKKLKQKEKKAILMNMGVIEMDQIHCGEDGKVVSIEARYHAEDKNFKKKQTMCWVADNGRNNLVPVKLVELDYLFDYVERESDEDDKKTKTVLEETGKQTWFETDVWAESAVKLLGKGEIIQFVKFGCFIVDKPYLGRPSEPAILIYIPDGKESKMSKEWEHLSKVASGAGAKTAKK